MSKKMPSNNQNEVNLSQMINNINRGGNNISQNDIKNMDMLEKLSKPIKPRKMSTPKKIMIGLVSIAGIAALPIPLVMFMKDRKVYVTTIIDYNIEELSDTQIKYKKGSTVNDLQIMEVEGYRFAGWYADKDFTIRLSPDEQLYNTTIYARYVKQVKVNTIIDGKTFEHKLDVGTKIKDINIDIKPSMRFDGWYTNNTYESSDRIDENTIIDSDQTIFGRYIQQIQIDVYVDGIFKKELIKDKGVTLQEFESEIQQPNQTYKSFDGWYTDVACTNRLGASDPIESDEIIYGRYVAEQVTININIDGVVESTTANKGMTFGEFKSNLPPMDKQYYDFYGWYTTDAYNIEVDDSTKLLNEITIYGKYVLQQATITLNIEDEVARSVTLNKTTTLDDIDLESLGLGERNGYRFDGWYKNSARTEPWNDDDIFTSNITLYGKYIKQVNIQIFVDGQEKGLLTKDIGVSLQQLTDELKQPDKPYMTFDGWYTDASCSNELSLDEPITEDKVIYGKYVNNQITISFDVPDTSIDDVLINQGSQYSDIKSTLPVPYKSFNTFDGWYTTADYVTKIDDATVLTEDLTLYGKFNVNKTTITLRIEGEEDIILENIDQGQKITDIDLESYNLGIRDGYRFSGWYADGDYKIPWYDHRPFEDDSCELYGKYTEILGIALIVENTRTGEKASQDYEYNAGDKVRDLPSITEPDNTNSWVFDGWYSDAEYTDKLDGSTTLEKGKSYYARFIQQFNIDILVEGEAPHAQMVSYNDTVAVLGDMSKSGYEFDGWYANDDYTGYLDANYTFTANGAVYGRYKPEITLVINGNNKIITVISGTTLEQNLDKWESLVDIAGYGFRGWFSDINCNNSWATTTALTTPTTIYAKLVEQVTVSVYLNGNQIDEKTIDKNTLFKDVKDTINNVTIPTGYKFVDWYKDAEYNTPWLDNDEIDGNYNIYGHYTINEFTLTVNIDGTQTLISADYETVLSEAIAEISTSREGYRFDGWYTNDGYTEIADLNHKITSDYTVYGRFIDTVDVKVYLNGTELTESAKTIDAEMTFEEYKSAYIDISDKIPEGNKFDDWYTDSTYTTKWNNSDLITDDNNEIWGRYSAQYAIYTNIDGVTQTINLTELTFDALEIATSINDHNSPGWYTDEKLMEPVVTLENNTTIYTKRVTAEMLDNLKFTQLGDSTYKVTGKSSTITGDIVIPRMYNNKNVTKLNFSSHGNITSISIPDTVIEIDNSAFLLCTSLQNITIPNSVTKIGKQAFMATYKLESIILPNKLITLGDECFQYGNLEEMTIPNSVKSVGKYCFAWTNLTEIIIPSGVESLGERVFDWCQSLERIEVIDNTTYDSRNNCNAIIETATNKLIAGCQNSTIPNTVTSIGDYAFHGHSSLHTITIPRSVADIGIRVFAYGNLSSIIVDEGNTTYDSRNNCNAIIETATNKLIAGGKNSIIPNTVTSIGDYAFEGQLGINTISLNKVQIIGGYAFSDCFDLSSIVIPRSVTRIERCVFSGCSKLKSIIVETGNTVYDSRENCNAIIETASNKLIVGCGSTVIPNSIIEIDTYAFNKVGELTSITIPNSVVKIGLGAFTNQEKLTEINFEESDGWYRTLNATDANNMTGGTLTDLSDASANATLFTTTYEKYYWYKNGNLPEDYLAWDTSTSSYYVKQGGSSLPATLIIPSVYNDGIHGVASVTKIGDSAFDGCSQITSIIIPESVTNIDRYAFRHCSGLTNITLPNNITSIGDAAFNSCSGLTSIVIPEGVTEIKDTTFNECVMLESITINGNVTSIGMYAFKQCGALQSITIQGETISIGDSAFEDCLSLKQVVLPENVTRLGHYAFDGCEALESITEINGITMMGINVFYNCRSLKGISLSCEVETFIQERTFYNCTSLENVSLSNIKGALSQEVFYNCTSLKDTSILNSITSIGARAFSGCGFENLIIPSNITSIEIGAFSNCAELISVTIPTSVTSIGKEVFLNCANLSSIIFEDPTGWYVTQDETDWENKTGGTPVALGTASENVTLFSETYAQYYWYKIPANLPSDYLAYDTEQSCYYVTKGTSTLPANLVIPATYNDGNNGIAEVKYIEEGIFANSGTICSSDVQTIILPNTITSIARSAFAGCDNLISVTIPSSVTSIGRNAFTQCTSLTNIIIPNSVISIEDDAFRECTSLTSITIPSSVTSIGTNPFVACSNLTSIVVDSENKYYHSNGDNGDNCNAIIESDANELITGCQATVIPSSVTTIGVDAFYGQTNITSITIPKGVTLIRWNPFAACSNLTSIVVDSENRYYHSNGDNGDNCNAIIESDANELITGCQTTVIPSDVTSIGRDAFTQCTSLTNIIIPNSVISIGDYAFIYCTSLTNIIIPNSVTSIGDYAFNNCSSLTSITIPNSVTSIGDGAFSHCFKLSSIDLSGCIGLTSIGDRVFSNCYELSSITIPNRVTKIGDWAFYDCYKLSSIDLSGCIGLTSIGYSAFSYCYGLSNITIPSSVTSISRFAFERCNKLTNITFEGYGVWFRTDNETNWKNKVDGTPTDLEIGENNATLFKGEYIRYYWYKITSNLPADYIAWDASTSSYYVKAGTSELPANLVIPATYNDGEHGVADVTSIGDNAFYNCTALESITLPSSVTTIEETAFMGCDNLKTVYNLSSLDIIKGERTHGYVAYYADIVYTSLPE